MSELQGTPQTEAHTQETTQHPRASVQHRLGGNVLDVLAKQLLEQVKLIQAKEMEVMTKLSITSSKLDIFLKFTIMYTI